MLNKDSHPCLHVIFWAFIHSLLLWRPTIKWMNIWMNEWTNERMNEWVILLWFSLQIFATDHFLRPRYHPQTVYWQYQISARSTAKSHIRSYFSWQLEADASFVIVITCLFPKLPWLGDSERTFRSSSQAATCPPVYHTQWRFHTVFYNAESQARSPP